MSTCPFSAFGIPKTIVETGRQALSAVADAFSAVDNIRLCNQLRVIRALQEAETSENWFGGSTGYGYGDIGRDKLEQAFAKAFGAEAALARIQISSGTQALALCLQALLRPGDELLIATGDPYDTLQTVIGLGDEPDANALHTFGITIRVVPLTADGQTDPDAVSEALSPRVKVILIQKSRGYSDRKTLLAQDIETLCQRVRNRRNPAPVILVDNCYGEFVETREPCMVGADLCAGSLIKNPGGGICPSGGYVAGRADLIRKIAARLNAPGLEDHVGPTLGFTRILAQGLYLAPLIVSECVKGAVFAAEFFSRLGLAVSPAASEPRGDIVQIIRLGNRDRLIRFCQAIQAAAPVDSQVRPEPWPMPGYAHDVIMAAGTFVQGSSIELSADGPLREPYNAYLQGGLTLDQVRLACLLAAARMQEAAT